MMIMQMALRQLIPSAVWLVASVCAAPALAGVFRLDDSSSPRSRVPAQSVLSESGRPLATSAFARTAHVRFGRIDYRLAAASYIGKNAKIYYVVPASIPGLPTPQALRVEWRAVGTFASGTARPGDRALVWQGVITQPWLLESIELSAQLDLDAVRLPPDGNFGFECYFEIETLP